MYVTMYIYTSQLPGFEMQLFRCLNCGRALFKASAEHVLIANIAGMNHVQHAPGAAYFEHQCHSCKTEYRVLFQQN